MWLLHPPKFSFGWSLQFIGILIVILFSSCQLQPCLGVSFKDEMFLMDAQKEAFERFKTEALRIITTPYMKNDIVLMKYFRYADMNENKSMEVLKDNLKWRLEQEMDPLTADDIAEFSRNYSFLKIITDKLGREIYYIPSKNLDCSVITKTPEISKKTMKYFYYMAEEGYKKVTSNVTGKNRVGSVVLSDIMGFPVSKVNTDCINFGAQFVHGLIRRWPGALDGTISVNVDVVSMQAGKLLISMLPKDFQSHAILFGEDDTVWMPELLKFLDANQLPPELYARSQALQKQMALQQKNPGASFLQVFGQPSATPGKPASEEGSPKPKTKKNKTKKPKKDDDDDDDDAGLD